MRKAGFVLLLLLASLSLLAAQEDDQEPSIDSEWDDYILELYSPGDQTFNISLGVIFPAVFYNSGKIIDPKFDPPVGGTGSLSYNYFVTSHVFLGAEAGIMFLPTIGKNTLFTIPVGLRGGYQFNIWRMEFPLTLTAGLVWHRYLDDTYFGIYVKGGAAAFFRATPDWSFGIAADWSWFPQWTSDITKNVDGNIIGLTLAARYHF
jgi:hypothetical protein